jgi:hypothetical protein
MAEMVVRAKERRRILHMVSDSIPQQVRFEATALGAGPVGGVVEVCGSRWLFRKAPARQPLQSDNLVRKGAFDTLFSVYVTPDQDTRIALRSRHFTARMLALALLAVAAAGAAGVLAYLISGR